MSLYYHYQRSECPRVHRFPGLSHSCLQKLCRTSQMRDRPRHEPSGHTKGHKARRYTVTVHSLTYTRVKFWKDRHKQNFAQVATKYAYSQLRMYKPAKIHISKERNLIGRSITTVSPALSHRSILPPPSSHFAFVPARKKKIRCFLKMSPIHLLKSLTNRVSLKVLS